MMTIILSLINKYVDGNPMDDLTKLFGFMFDIYSLIVVAYIFS